jgi:hypothetical protein
MRCAIKQEKRTYEYEDYCADRVIPCIKKSPERIAFIRRAVDGFERKIWEWLDENVVSREW